MIYQLIYKSKFKKILRALVFIMLFSFSALLYSCQTVGTEYYTPEELKADKELKTDEDAKLIEAKTKNDSTINLTNCTIVNDEKHKVSSNILLLEKTDKTYFKDLGRTAYKLKKSLTELNLKDIKNIKVERTKIDWVATSIVCLLGVIILAFVAIGIGMHGAFNSFGGGY